MSSAGYMYTQIMDETSRAQHGPFYVTNVLEITHEDLKVSLTYACATNILLQNCDAQNIPLSHIYKHLVLTFLNCSGFEIYILWLQDSNGQVAGGGVSVYYSHVLQMLFFSYSQGKSFAATVSRSTTEVQRLFPINIKG